MKDFAELVVTAAEISGDVNAANYAASLVGIAEKKLSRRIKVRQSIDTVNVTTDAEGFCALPRGFIDIVHIFENKKEMFPVPLRSILENSRKGYAIVGDRIRSSYGDRSHEITFYKELPSLSEEGCNWLLEQAPDIYLQSLLLELAVKAREIETAAITQAYLDRLITEFVSVSRTSATNVKTAGGCRP